MPPAYRNVRDFGGIQDCINRGPGTVYFPAGDYYYTKPIILPRTDLFGNGGVAILGDGPGATRFLPATTANVPWGLPSLSWAAGAGVFEWAPPDYDKVIRRAWYQRIEGIHITLPNAESCGIRYRRENLSFGAIYEKMTLRLSDVVMNAFCDWPQVCLKIEGNAHMVLVDGLTGNFGSRGSVANDGLLIQFDDGLDDGNDNTCAFQSQFHNLSTSNISGGPCGVFYGRCINASFRNIQAGRGSMGRPQFHLRNSICVRVEGFTTEGLAETSQFLLEGCRGVVMDPVLMGTPNQYIVTNPPGTYAPGTGVTFRNSYGCRLRWPANNLKPLWNTLPTLGNLDPSPGGGSWRVTLDAGSKANVIDLDATQISSVNEELATMVRDLGVNNEVIVRNAWTGAISRSYNQQPV